MVGKFIHAKDRKKLIFLEKVTVMSEKCVIVILKHWKDYRKHCCSLAETLCFLLMFSCWRTYETKFTSQKAKMFPNTWWQKLLYVRDWAAL